MGRVPFWNMEQQADIGSEKTGGDCMSELDAIQMPAAAVQTERSTASGWRELLELNRGRRVTAEFLLGENMAVTKAGVIYAVQPDYLILTDDYGNYVAADLYSLRFVTFCPDCITAQAERDTAEEPAKIQPEDLEGNAEQAAAKLQAARTAASLAALNYAKRKARRLE